MKYDKYSFRQGINCTDKNITKDVEEVLNALDTEFCKGCTTEIREKITNPLIRKGWSKDIFISSNHRITIPLVFRDVALFIQTGNMARYYADILKLQAQFLNKKIKCAIYVVPTKESAKKLGANHVHYDRVTSELEDVFSNVITVPVIIYGLYNK